MNDGFVVGTLSVRVKSDFQLDVAANGIRRLSRWPSHNRKCGFDVGDGGSTAIFDFERGRSGRCTMTGQLAGCCRYHSPLSKKKRVAPWELVSFVVLSSVGQPCLGGKGWHPGNW